MKKRISGLTLTLPMAAASLTGCGDGGTTETTVAATGDTATAAAAKTTTAAAATGDTVLEWAVWNISLTTYYQPLVDEFEAANPDVETGTVDLGSADYQAVLATELTGSSSNFDMVAIEDIPGHATLVNKGVLEPLDDYIIRGNVDLSAYGDVTGQAVVNDKLHEFPFRNDFWVVSYNEDVLDNAGVVYPTNDMTFEQCDELAGSVTDTTPGQEVYGAHYHTQRSVVQLFGILDSRNSTVDGIYDLLKSYYEMVLTEQSGGICQDYATLKTSDLHYSGAFTQGNIAMINMDAWHVPALIDKLESGEYSSEVANQGIVRYPHAEGVESGTTLSAIASLIIPAPALNKDLAWGFLKCVYGPDGMGTIAETGTFPTIQIDIIVEAISSLEGFPGNEGSAEALKTAKTYLEMPVHPKDAGAEIVLNEAHDVIITEDSTTDEGIAQMDEQVGAILTQ